MTCCACFVVAYFLLKNAPLILKRAWNRKGLFEGQEFVILNIYKEYHLLDYRLVLQEFPSADMFPRGNRGHVLHSIWYIRNIGNHNPPIFLYFPPIGNIVQVSHAKEYHFIGLQAQGSAWAGILFVDCYGVLLYNYCLRHHSGPICWQL